MAQIEAFTNPPNIDEIDAIFHVKGKPVLYAWGGFIYNPERIVIPPELRSHEAVHGQRQGSTEVDIRKWWDRYLQDRDFRLGEELVAHRAELGAIKTLHKDRNVRIRYAHAIAERLSGAIYGGMITKNEALGLLLK